MAKTKKEVKPTKPEKPTARKKYQSQAGLDCLDCNLPMHVCCGIPKQCRARYEKYLEKRRKLNASKTH